MSQEYNMLDATQENQSSYPVKEKESHLIQDEHFQKLLNLQEDIYQATRVKPSMYKLVNLILEKSDLNAIREQLIRQYQ